MDFDTIRENFAVTLPVAALFGQGPEEWITVNCDIMDAWESDGVPNADARRAVRELLNGDESVKCLTCSEADTCRSVVRVCMLTD